MPGIESLYDLDRCDSCDVVSCNVLIRTQNTVDKNVQALFEGLVVVPQDVPDSVKEDAIVTLDANMHDTEAKVRTFKILAPNCSHDDFTLGRMLDAAHYFLDVVEES